MAYRRKKRNSERLLFLIRICVFIVSRHNFLTILSLMLQTYQDCACCRVPINIMRSSCLCIYVNFGFIYMEKPLWMNEWMKNNFRLSFKKAQCILKYWNHQKRWFQTVSIKAKKHVKKVPFNYFIVWCN